MSQRRPPGPEPFDVDVVRVVAVGTAVWFVAFLILLPFHGRLAGAGHGEWVWTCLAGWALGLLGILVARAQRAARRVAQHAARAVAGTQPERDPAATRDDGEQPPGPG